MNSNSMVLMRLYPHPSLISRSFFIILVLFIWIALPISTSGETTPGQGTEINEDPIIITGSEENTDDEIEEITPSSSINAERIERKGATNLNEALENETGLRLRSQCNICNSNEVMMRGLSGRHNLITFNNNPILSDLALNYVLSSFPTSMIQEIEVIKGPGDARYGGRAMSGIINVDIQRPEEELFTIDAAGQVSSEFGYLVNFTGSLALDHFSWILAFQRDSAEATDPDNNDLSNSPEFTNNAVLTYLWADMGDFTLYSNVSYYNEERFGGDLKEELYEKWGLENLGGYYEDIVTNRVEGMIDLQWDFNEPSYLKMLLSGSYHHQDSELSFQKYLATQGQFNAELSYRQLIGDYLFLEPGFEFQMDDIMLSQEKTEKIRFLYSGYLMAETMILYPFTAKAGLRFDFSDTFGYQFSPRVETLYEVDQTYYLRLSYGHGFVLPRLFFAQTHFPPGGTYIIRIDEEIGAEVSESFNFNAEAKWGFLNISLDVFFIWVRGLILGIPAGIDKTTHKLILEYQNSGKAYSTGVEADIKLDFSQLTTTFFKHFYIQLGYSFDYARDYKTQTAIPFHPEHSANGELVFNQKEWGTLLSVLVSFTGRMRVLAVERYSDDTEAILEGQSPYYTLLNLYISQSFWNDYITIFVGIKNIFDFRQKFWSKDNQYVWGPISGRIYYGGLQISF